MGKLWVWSIVAFWGYSAQNLGLIKKWENFSCTVELSITLSTVRFPIIFSLIDYPEIRSRIAGRDCKPPARIRGETPVRAGSRTPFSRDRGIAV